MNWKWLGSEKLADHSGTATLMFAEQNISFDLPSFTIAYNLMDAIEREIQRAREQGRQELSDEIRKALEQQR